MTDFEKETYFYDPDTGDRVMATYRVLLIAPATFVGEIEIDARSEEEAARLALERADDAEWDHPQVKDCSGVIEVLDIECDDSPLGAVLYRPSESKDSK
jgi:hypothetical protein